MLSLLLVESYWDASFSSDVARANHLLLQEFTIHKMTFNSNNGQTPFRVTLTDFKYLFSETMREDRFS